MLKSVVFIKEEKGGEDKAKKTKVNQYVNLRVNCCFVTTNVLPVSIQRIKNWCYFKDRRE